MTLNLLGLKHCKITTTEYDDNCSKEIITIYDNGELNLIFEDESLCISHDNIIIEGGDNHKLAVHIVDFILKNDFCSNCEIFINETKIISLNKNGCTIFCETKDDIKIFFNQINKMLSSWHAIF